MDSGNAAIFAKDMHGALTDTFRIEADSIVFDKTEQGHFKGLRKGKTLSVAIVMDHKGVEMLNGMNIKTIKRRT